MVAQISPDMGFGLSFVFLVVGLVLEEEEFEGLVIGAVVGQVGHPQMMNAINLIKICF